MSELTDCFLSTEPKLLQFPEGIEHPSDPVDWAMGLYANGVAEADMQIMRSSSGDEELEISFFDQKDPASFERFKTALQSGQPVHGSLALIDYCDNDGMLRNGANWAWDVFNAQFAEGLAKCHPLGSYLKATLWTSCGEHRYRAHCDLADGFLLHISGHKRVRIWPVPEKYLHQTIFDHSDFEGRMESESIDFEMSPGQILFIPGGAMHEVVAHGETAAVSVSYHMGSPFPLLTLCDQLNRMAPDAEVSLPPEMMGQNKFELSFFQPTRHTNQAGVMDEAMPDELANALLDVLHSQQLEPDAMRALLSDWWRLAVDQRAYQGPYPRQ
jgi:hypothetical protein